MKRLPHTSRAGFTVLELIIVMGLVLFLASGTLLGFSSITSNSKLGKAGSIVEGAMRQARSYAVANSRDVLIVFTTIDTGWAELAQRGIGVFDPIDNDYAVQFKTVPRATGFSGITKQSDGSPVPTRQVPYKGGSLNAQWIWLDSNGTLIEPVNIEISRGAVINGVLDTTKTYGSGPQTLIVPLKWAAGSL